MMSGSGSDNPIKTPTPAKRLKGRTTAVGNPPGFSPWGMVLFGLPFAGAGCWITLVGLEVVPVEASSVHAPMWVLTVVGLIFFAAGLTVWGMAWTQASRERKRKQHTLLHPGVPAMEDHPWDSSGYSPDRWKPVIQGIGAALFMTVFLSVFNWWAFVSGDGPWMVKAIVGIFDLILIGVWVHAIKAIIHAIKFGRTRLNYSQFPYFHGDWFQAQVELPSGLEQIDKAKLILRCVREFYETTGRGKNRSKRVVHEQLWSEDQVLSGAEIGRWPRHLNATFVLPAQEIAPGTEIRSEKPIFWELEMELAVPGVDLKQRYLVPVYAQDFGKGVPSGSPTGA
jgi:hypothetical protein